MKRLAAVLSLLATPALAGGLDGAWEGTIVLDKSEHPFDAATQIKTRMELQGTVAHVFVYESGKKTEIGAGTFQVAQHGANAVVFASEDGESFPPRAYTQTWSYTLTTQWDDTLLVEYARVGRSANDEVMRGDVSSAAVRGEGVLKRVDPP